MRRVFDGTSRSEPTKHALERAVGGARLRWSRGGVAELRQEGALKLRLPRGSRGEAVLVNTAGGLAGGDRFSCDVAVDDGAAVTITSAACEKVYRSDGARAELDIQLAARGTSRLEWLPQETILFDRSNLHRRLTVELDGPARVLLAEGVVFGRTAHGEAMREGVFRDFWTVRRDGRLVYAEATRLEGGIAATLARPAVLAGGCAAATILYVAPDAMARRDALRTALADGDAEAGASERDGVLLARIAARDGLALRRALLAAITVLRDAPPPKVWMC
jgi:urease accessory protein